MTPEDKVRYSHLCTEEAEKMCRLKWPDKPLSASFLTLMIEERALWRDSMRLAKVRFDAGESVSPEYLASIGTERTREIP